MDKPLKYRLYIFVERHLSSIDKGIQACHSVCEYICKFNESKNFKHWVKYDKTIIMLNGGSVKELEELKKCLELNGIDYAEFREDDLNNSLTSICLLADERTFDFSRYPDYEIYKGKNIDNGFYKILEDHNDKDEYYKNLLGGRKNLLLRDLIQHHHLAR